MSNALPLRLQKLLAAATTSRPATQPSEGVSVLMTTLCGVGICVFLIWLARTVNNPAKVKLSVCPGRSNRLTPIHVIVLLLISRLGGGLVVQIIGPAVELGTVELVIIGGAVSQLLLLAGGLMIAAYSFAGGALRGMGFTGRRWINDGVRSVIGILAILPVCMGLLLATRWLLQHWNPDLLAPHQFLEILTDPKTQPFWRWMVIATAAVLAPLGEEVFFRGLVQSMFRRYLRRPWVAIVLTSILFSAMHFTVIYSLPALFALSLALGYNYERTGRLYSPIMIHMLFNLANIADTLIRTAT